MKKFSKKLVSRCVYCNVLKATKSDILTAFLDQHGWNTINMWLQDAKDNENCPFLLELLKMCKILPMTVDRLKQNNTAKLIKALTKSDNEDIKVLSTELVICWMSLIKGEKNDANQDKSKKRRKKEGKGSKDNKEQKDLKEVSKEKNLKVKHFRDSKEKIEIDQDEKPKLDEYDDVKITEEPQVKKPKIDRPKTVKTFHAKFRSTGLEEETPLPKNVTKKTPTVNKTAAVAAAKSAVKRMNTVAERFTEKKIKPASLITPSENNNTGTGIKLIPPKPRPVHVLHESASFMDALVAAPAQPVRRKKKSQGNKPPPPTTPPSPTLTPPKLQFYKDTLDMSTEDGTQGEDETNVSENNDDNTDKPSEVTCTQKTEEDKKETDAPLEEQEQNEENDDTLICNPGTPVEAAAEENEETENTKEKSDTSAWTVQPSTPPAADKLQSILCHGKKRGQRKSVKWADESNLKHIYYFDLDETERVNVNHVRNFGDLKSLEMKREREAFETARRLMGDKMEETISWTTPFLIDLPPPLVEAGANSKEKEIQQSRQETTLQEIYFSRGMLPDSPYEPDPELYTPQEPRFIPLEDDNNIGSLMDYSMIDLPAPKTSLPDVLSHLVMSIASRGSHPVPPDQPMENVLHPMDMNTGCVPGPGQYEPGGDGTIGSGGLLGLAPPGYAPQGYSEGMDAPSNWGPVEEACRGMPLNDPAYGSASGNHHMHMSGPPPSRSARPRMAPPMRHSTSDDHRHSRGSQGPHRQSGMARNNRGPPRVPCKYFTAGTCRWGSSCTFLHPGINGPL